MSGISGLGGVGSLDPSAWIGLTGVSSVSASAAAAVAPAASSGAAIVSATHLQTLVEFVRQYGIAEVLLALLFAARAAQKETYEDRRSVADSIAGLALAGVLSQQLLINGRFEVAIPAVTSEVGAATSLNVLG